jgi:predicted dehydrogenase
VKLCVIGIGKMGISHLAIINDNPNVQVVGVCDPSPVLLTSFKQLTTFPFYSDYKEMLLKTKPDAVIIATPTQTHFEIASYSLEKGCHVFLEKPFSQNMQEANELIILAKQKSLVNQVGYHNRFISTFKAAKQLQDQGLIGEVYHISGEANGPAVLKASKNWRTTDKNGGGCLLDYGSHVINLMNFFMGSVLEVKGVVKQNIYSFEVEDFVQALFHFENNVSGTLQLNWSDETFRRMTTTITILGKKGKIIVDSQEIKVFCKFEPENKLFKKGWNTKYITDFTSDIQFFVRGEEYSAQLEYFVRCIKDNSYENVNSFVEATKTIATIDKIKMEWK